MNSSRGGRGCARMKAVRGPREIRRSRSPPEGSRGSRGEQAYENNQKERFGLRQRVKAAEQEVEEMSRRLSSAEKRERAMQSEIALLKRTRDNDGVVKYDLREELRSRRRDYDKLQRDYDKLHKDYVKLRNENKELKSRKENKESKSRSEAPEASDSSSSS